jgi:hypothetical protein
VLQNDPNNNEALKELKALEDHLRSLAETEGKKVADICRLIHTKSGLLSELPMCRDKNYVLDMARKIVSGHGRQEPEAQGAEPFDQDLYLSLVQNEGERLADISRQIYDVCALSSRDVDWDLLSAQARWILSPYSGQESEAQANMEIGCPGVHLKED